jgi:hypothetical protein
MWESDWSRGTPFGGGSEWVGPALVHGWVLNWLWIFSQGEGGSFKVPRWVLFGPFKEYGLMVQFLSFLDRQSFILKRNCCLQRQIRPLYEGILSILTILGFLFLRETTVCTKRLFKYVYFSVINYMYITCKMLIFSIRDELCVKSITAYIYFIEHTFVV